MWSTKPIAFGGHWPVSTCSISGPQLLLGSRTSAWDSQHLWFLPCQFFFNTCELNKLNLEDTRVSGSAWEISTQPTWKWMVLSRGQFQSTPPLVFQCFMSKECVYTFFFLNLKSLAVFCWFLPYTVGTSHNYTRFPSALSPLPLPTHCGSSQAPDWAPTVSSNFSPALHLAHSPSLGPQVRSQHLHLCSFPAKRFNNTV